MEKKELALPEDSECACPKCKSACRHSRPGLFMPKEVEQAASLMGMQLDEFFKTYLGVDWWEDDGIYPETFMIAPVTDAMEPGGMYLASPRGACVLLDQETDQCKIHEAKPMECRKFLHDMSDAESNKTRGHIVEAWMKKQEMIKELLGQEPEAVPYSILDHLR